MASTHYLGQLSNGRLVSRKSNRSDFTHAAIAPTAHTRRAASFSTSAAGAIKNYSCNVRPGLVHTIEVVPVRIVTAKEYKAALANAKGA